MKCHPHAESHCLSRDKVEVLMNRFYGGYCNGQKCLLSDGNGKQQNGNVHVYRYRCRIPNCGLRLQVRFSLASQWQVYSRENSSHQNHSIEDQTTRPKDQFGLHPVIKEIADTYANDVGKSILRITPAELVFHITRTIHSLREYDSVLYQVTKADYLAHLKIQILNFISLRREKYI